MVDFSLKKGRKYGKQAQGTTQPKSKPKAGKASNPYSDMNVSAQYSQLPKINAKDKNKVASSMQRRLSVHNANYVPPKLDYSMPLPSSTAIGMTSFNENEEGQPQNVASDLRNFGNVSDGNNVGEQTSESIPKGVPFAFMKPESLRALLADPKFNAKTFVHDALGDASAIEIDKFTSNLSELAIEVQEEARDNINTSYNEILNVNRDLGIASLELKQLRSSAKELTEMMQQFFMMAEKRLQTENHLEQSHNAASPGLLPPVRAGSIGGNERDRSSVAILERIWDNQLSTLFKNVEGARKYISASPGRHILLESGDWIELNLATLKPLQSVHIFILNDMVLVAARPREKQKELVVAQCAHLRDVNVTPEGASQKRLSFSFGHTTRCIYECRDPQEGPRLLNVIRRAKDDFHDIFQAEEENARKIKESFSYLQSTQQTPGREGTKSPVKNARRSLGSVTPGRNGGDAMDSYLFQKITMSMHSRSRSRDVTSVPQKLKFLDDGVEEIDIELGRLKFGKAVDALNALETQLKKLADQGEDDDMMLHGLITLKINQRRDAVAAKLSHTITTTSEMAPLIVAVKNMIKLGLSEDGLDLFLQNRSNYIQDLILQIGSLDNTANYLTQIAVIRFQSIKKTIINFREIFQEDKDRFSSILVNWCREEADQHFLLIEKQLPNDEPISPASIRSSRKQIDGLKSVGLDFVYKLDDFIRKNNHKIR